MVAGFFLEDHPADEQFQLRVGCTPLHLGVQVVVPDGKQAGADLAVGGEADPAAVSAERMGDGRDDSDFAHAVVESVAAGGLGALVRNLDQGAVCLLYTSDAADE